MKEFVKMPSYWITDQEKPGLRQLNWGGQNSAGKIAALMLYIAIAHNAKRESDQLPAIAKLSYSDFEDIVGIGGRATISAGLKKLEELEIVKIDKRNRTNVYQLNEHPSKKGWAKLPYKHLYLAEQIKVFAGFSLRRKTELNALKMYLLVAAFRNNISNHTVISYEKINLYTGIAENDIRGAISLLVVNDLIHVDRDLDEEDIAKSKNIYRLVGLKGRHLGNLSKDDLVPTSRNFDSKRL